MESCFATSFEDVRVHVGDDATLATAAVDARAFTRGSDIVFSSGAFDPHAGDGRELLAHELAHVVQQRSTSGPLASSAHAEAEADRAAAAGRLGGPAEVHSHFMPGIQRKEVPEAAMLKPSVTVSNGDGADIVSIQGVPAYRVVAVGGGKPERKSGGGGSYTRLKGKEFGRAGNSVSWRWTIPLSYYGNVVVTQIPSGMAQVQKMLPSVEFATSVSVVEKPAPVAPPKKLVMQADGSLVMQEQPSVLSMFSLQPTLVPIDDKPEIDLTRALKGLPPPGAPGELPFIGKKPEWMKDMQFRTGPKGTWQVWSPQGLVWSSDPREKPSFPHPDLRNIERTLEAMQELQAHGGKRIVGGKALDDKAWSDHVWNRIRIVQAEANRALENLSSAVDYWNEAQDGVAKLASVPSHVLGGRSLDDAKKILAAAVQDVEIGIRMMEKARTPKELAEAEQVVQAATRRGDSSFFNYKEDVFTGGERTITGIKIAAVAATAHFAAPVLFGYFGGGAAAGLGANIFATGMAAGSGGLLTGTMGGLLESADKGLSWENYGKGFADHWSAGFAAGLSAGGSFVLKMGPGGPLASAGNLGKTALLHGGSSAAGDVSNALIHGESGSDAAWAGFRGALTGAITGVIGGAVGEKLHAPPDASKWTKGLQGAGSTLFQGGFGAGFAGLTTALSGGSEDEIRSAMLIHGVVGASSSRLPQVKFKPGVAKGFGGMWKGKPGAAKAQPPVVQKVDGDKPVPAAAKPIANQEGVDGALTPAKPAPSPANPPVPGAGPGHPPAPPAPAPGPGAAHAPAPPAPAPAPGHAPAPPAPAPAPGHAPAAPVAAPIPVSPPLRPGPAPAVAPNEVILPQSGLTKRQHKHFESWSKRAMTPADEEAVRFQRANTIRTNRGQPEYPDVAAWKADAKQARTDRRVARDQEQASRDPARQERLRFEAANRARAQAGQPEYPTMDDWRAGTNTRADRRAIRAAEQAMTPQAKRSLGQKVGRWLRPPPSRGVDVDGNDIPIGQKHGLTPKQRAYFRQWEQSAASNPAELAHARQVKANVAAANRAQDAWRAGVPAQGRAAIARDAQALVNNLTTKPVGSGKIIIHPDPADPHFETKVRQELEAIARTPAGKQMLEELTSYGKDVVIGSPAHSPANWASSGPHALADSWDSVPKVVADQHGPLRKILPKVDPAGNPLPGHDYTSGQRYSLQAAGPGSGTQIIIDPNNVYPHQLSHTRGMPSDVILAHELNHARNNARGMGQGSTPQGPGYTLADEGWSKKWHNVEEHNTVQFENAYREQRGGAPFRRNYLQPPAADGSIPTPWWQW